MFIYNPKLQNCYNFENTGYNVYLRGDKYTYNNELHTVKDNELLVAIKEKRNKNELKKN